MTSLTLVRRVRARPAVVLSGRAGLARALRPVPDLRNKEHTT
jgi:hypothetical protein